MLVFIIYDVFQKVYFLKQLERNWKGDIIHEEEICNNGTDSNNGTNDINKSVCCT